MSQRYDFVTIPLYALGEGVVGDLKRISFGLGRRYLVVCDRHVTPELRERIAVGFGRPLAEPSAPGTNMLGRAAGLMDSLGRCDLSEDELSLEFMDFAPKACTVENARELGELIEPCRADVVVAVGGGKCLDLVRAALHFCGAYGRPRLVMVPTIITTNACANGMSIMYDERGQMCDFWNLALPPECCVVDTGLIAQAPARFLAAGIGDQLSSSLEALHTLRHLGLVETTDPLAVAHHEAVLGVLERYGAEALEAVRRHEVTRPLEFVCHALTRYTGPELAVATSFVSHVLDEALISLPGLEGRMHGEIVGYGILPELVLADERDQVPRWAQLLGSLGLPRTLAELGAPDATYEDVLAVCEGAADKIMASRALARWSPEQLAGAVIASDCLVHDVFGSGN